MMGKKQGKKEATLKSKDNRAELKRLRMKQSTRSHIFDLPDAGIQQVNMKSETKTCSELNAVYACKCLFKPQQGDWQCLFKDPL